MLNFQAIIINLLNGIKIQKIDNYSLKVQHIGYNYQSSEWYKNSYTVFKKNYKKNEKKINKKKKDTILKKFKSILN